MATLVANGITSNGQSNGNTIDADGLGAAQATQEAAIQRRLACYSELQLSRMAYTPRVPPVLLGRCVAVAKESPPPVDASHVGALKELFPLTYGQSGVELIPHVSGDAPDSAPLKIGVVLSGGQAPGGHNVIAGIYDYLQEYCKGSEVYGFKNGPIGIIQNDYLLLKEDYIRVFRNQGGFDIIHSGRTKIETPEQFKASAETVKSLGLDGLIVIGGDDSNTNAAILAEYFKANGVSTKVIGVPKTIDGDLKNADIATSFGFDTACKTYSEMIGNIMIDSRSACKYYHFVRLMGRAASHITLECSLQTHPNATIIGEEVAAKRLHLSDLTNAVADMIATRAAVGKNYGVVLLPEGLIDFVPEVSLLISELNDILASTANCTYEDEAWKAKLTPASLKLFQSFPEGIARQLLLDRDPHGNVQVAQIETEKLLISLVEKELKNRKAAGTFKGSFSAITHFFGYEGRCGLPSNFDCNYCYILGQTSASLVHHGQTGLMATVKNLTSPPEQWSIGGTPITAMMTIERRKGKNKPVIQKALVELNSKPFLTHLSLRDYLATVDMYRSPGPIQFDGPNAHDSNFTLKLEAGDASTVSRFEHLACQLAFLEGAGHFSFTALKSRV